MKVPGHGCLTLGRQDLGRQDLGRRRALGLWGKK